jgi:hypothetical protein
LRGVVAKGGNARKAAAQAAAESVGGTLELFYFALGGSDVLKIADIPDNRAAAGAGTGHHRKRTGDRSQYSLTVFRNRRDAPDYPRFDEHPGSHLALRSSTLGRSTPDMPSRS